MIKVLHYVSIMNRAGQETFIMNMYRRMNRSKIQFGFLCSKSGTGDYDSEIRSLGGEIFHVQLDHSGKKTRHINNYKMLKSSFNKYTNAYQVIHIHNYHAFDITIEAIAALKAGFQKVVVHSHNSSADGHLTLHKLTKPIISKLHVVRLACSEDAKKWMYQTNDAIIVNNGIIIKDFLPQFQIRQKYRKQLGLENSFVIGNIARFFPQKNHGFMIRLFAEYYKQDSSAKLMLIGEGELKNEMQSLVKSLNIQNAVIFMGVREDTQKLYQVMDTFLFPSLFEGLGIVAIEAQAADLPCIVSNQIPKCVHITDRYFVCDLNSPMEEWIETIKKCKQISMEKRRNNEEIIRNAGFSADENARKLYKIYTS